MELDTIRGLLESGADPEKLNDISPDDESPGFYARLASEGETRILDVLLDKCSQDFKDKLDAEGLVYFAADQKGPKNRACIRMLLEKGFSVDQSCPTHDNRSAIHAALINGDMELLDLLLECGASVFTMSDSEGLEFLLPYVIAREMRYDDTVISRLIPEDINGTYDHPRTVKLGMFKDMELNVKGYSFLMCVCLAGGTSNALKYLLDLGADPKQCNNEGYGPFQAAMMTENYDIAHFLLPYTDLTIWHWTDINHIQSLWKDKKEVQWVFEQYIWHWWTGSGHKPNCELLYILLKAGADPNKPNAHGKFPLFLALEGSATGEMKDESDVTILLSSSADPNIVGQNNENALWWAAKSGYPPVLEAVLEANPDILLSDLKVKGRWNDCTYTTAMQEALKTQNPEIVNLCVQAGFGLQGTIKYLDKYSSHVSQYDEYKDPNWSKDLKPEVVEKIRLYSYTPRRLEEIAKYSILRCIPGDIWEVVEKANTLPLAQPQIDYLNYLTDIAV